MTINDILQFVMIGSAVLLVVAIILQQRGATPLLVVVLHAVPVGRSASGGK